MNVILGVLMIWVAGSMLPMLVAWALLHYGPERHASRSRGGLR